MSGPKGGAYRVESAAQREGRLLRDAKASYARALTLWQAACDRMAATGVTVGKKLDHRSPDAVPDHADSATYQRAAQELEAATSAAVQAAAAAREEFADAQYAAQVARIDAAIRAAASDTPAEQPTRMATGSSQDRQRSGEYAPAAPPPVDRARAGERVRRRLNELAAFEHDTERVQRLVGDIAQAKTESRIDLLVSELDIILAHARADAQRTEVVDKVRAQLDGLAACISDIDCAAADSVRSRITSLVAVRAESVPEDLTAAVGELLAEVDAEADRRHVIGAMHRALEQLGYAVGPEFATELGGPKCTAFVGGPAPGYGVKLRLEPQANRFSAQAVKSDAVLTTVEEDITAERQFCDAFEELVALTKNDGVTLQVDVALEPGEYPVQQVAADEVARSTRSAARVAPSEMRRPR